MTIQSWAPTGAPGGLRRAFQPGRPAASLPQHLDVIEAICAGLGRGVTT
ncbi:hypothetical protein [Nonomuraea roseoviolacea]|uniref:Uncharacterized protein n=1 Tax=Nonomuraea roseoviolacea subsp. carminata TaxID=160689 RepID=A0ABT1K1X0_9ACTN|nr:hypothetical protein [Nonomuraea roseoviolacea]MCP2347860.1 hypothetical protein [Nonomuraea roseoviolacea subsp. carminata]